jgi:hypothetical protein
MTYRKPTIQRLINASQAIQGLGIKGPPIAPDANPNVLVYTTGHSYDLDE